MYITDTFTFTLTEDGILCIELIKKKDSEMTSNDYHHYNFSYYNSICTLSIKYVKCAVGDIYVYEDNHYVCKTC